MHRAIAAAAGLLGACPLLSQDPPHVNRLAQETSPYLLQHQNNPVDWYPWGEEALERARREDKPIFLSIGYSACHWCHVMEHESFENPEIAAVMNDLFVNIKVDREERPDLDEIYMAAVQGMAGHGGWPMSVWLTPDLKPFYGGTYYPPDDKYGRPGFRRVIAEIGRMWRESRSEIESSSTRVVEYLEKVLVPESVAGDVRLEQAELAVRQSADRHDATYGGFAAPPNYAPKFPHASEISMLLRHHARTGDEQSLRTAELSLTRMAEGGIYDQLAGGFHRYSVDREWLVPHFEKMLYDNAQLARTYAEAYQITGVELYARTVRETLDYLLREMQDQEGGIWSSTDADSEGEEGKFFVWTKSEVDRLLGDDAKVACSYWGITEAGNWENNTVLAVVKSVATVAGELGMSEAEVQQALDRSRAILLETRSKRVPPGTDDKVLASWNGLAIAAFAVGYQVLGEPRYLDAAQRVAGFVLDEMREDGRLFRSWRKGRAHLMGYLDDYAFVADGLLCLYEADFDPRWLEESVSLLQQVQTHFLDESDGSFFFTADDHEQLVARSKSVGENSLPSGIAVAALSFIRAGLLLGDTELEDTGVQAMRSNSSILDRSPLASPSLVSAVQFHLGDPREVVVVGEPGDPTTAAFLRNVRAQFPPHRVVTLLHQGNRQRLQELGEIYVGKEPVDGKPAVYVCRRGVCEAPLLDPNKLDLR